MTMLIHIFEILTLGLVLLAAYRGHYHYSMATHHDAFSSPCPPVSSPNLPHAEISSPEITTHHFADHVTQKISDPLDKKKEKHHSHTVVKKDNALNDYIGDFF